jgi:hypothetical protein
MVHHRLQGQVVLGAGIKDIDFPGPDARIVGAVVPHHHQRPRPLKAIIDLQTAVQEVTVEPKSNQITLQVKRAAPGTK